MTGQTFDFAGPSAAAVAGEFSNLGRFHANHDGTNLFVGFSETMLYGDSTLFLFIEALSSSTACFRIRLKDNVARRNRLGLGLVSFNRD